MHEPCGVRDQARLDGSAHSFPGGETALHRQKKPMPLRLRSSHRVSWRKLRRRTGVVPQQRCALRCAHLRRAITTGQDDHQTRTLVTAASRSGASRGFFSAVGLLVATKHLDRSCFETSLESTDFAWFFSASRNAVADDWRVEFARSRLRVDG